jgi:hypothetical protein
MHFEEMVPTVPTEISRWFRKDILYHLGSAYILCIPGQHSLAVVKTFDTRATYVVVKGGQKIEIARICPCPTIFTVNKNEYRYVLNLLC